MNDMKLSKEEIITLLTLFGIFLGMIMTAVGLFVPHESPKYWEFMLPIGLPLWVFSTVFLTKDLTY